MPQEQDARDAVFRPDTRAAVLGGPSYSPHGASSPALATLIGSGLLHRTRRAVSGGLGAGHAAVISGSALTPSSGLVMVRTVWIAAILAGVLAVVLALLSGADSSRTSRQAALAPGFSFEAQHERPESTGAAPRDQRNRPAGSELTAERRPGSVAPGSAGRSTDVGTVPVATPQPQPEAQPTPAPRPRPTPAPRPRPTPTPQTPVSPQPTSAEPAQQPAVVANNNDGP